ncbi:MAG: chorismate mutase [Candidatus Bathyarchaeia archaeon]
MSLVHELKVLRGEIKSLTEMIVRLAWRRMSLAVEVGKIKTVLGLPIEERDVEEDLEREVLRLCSVEGIDREFALKILRLLIDESKCLQSLVYKNYASFADSTIKCGWGKEF